MGQVDLTVSELDARIDRLEAEFDSSASVGDLEAVRFCEDRLADLRAERRRKVVAASEASRLGLSDR